MSGKKIVILVILLLAAAAVTVLVIVKTQRTHGTAAENSSETAAASAQDADSKADDANVSSTDPGVAQESVTAAGSQDDTENEKAAGILASMSTEEKAAQLFFITPESLTGVSNVTQAGKVTENALQQYPVGGIILFSGNIVSEDQLMTMTQNLQSYSKIPLFIGVDEEGGSLVARVAKSAIDVPQVSDMADIGASGDINEAYSAGTVIGTYLKRLGFNMDFAPVADVLTNPDNTAIGKRSFGSDPAVVSKMVSAEVRGLTEQGISATLKHFPGHGGTSTDSHNGAAVVDRTMEELDAVEFLPFEAGIDAGADFILAGHLEVPQVTGNDEPASLSEEMITEILRGQLGYNGIVITDAMNMGAVTDYYSPAEAAVKAIEAGDDMILMPGDFASAYQGVVDAVNSGGISEDRLNESVMRILKVKYR